MPMTDKELLGHLDRLLPIRARLVTHRGGKERFELIDRHGNEFEIEGVSPLRIIVVLRKHGCPEMFEEIAVFDGEIVFSKPAEIGVDPKKSDSHPLDDNPFVRNFF